MTLDARLRRLYQGLDTSPGFDERVMSRVRAATASEAEARARARAEETRRYELEKSRHTWRAWIRQWLTPDVLGGAVFAGCVGDAIWTGIQVPGVALTPVNTLLGLTAFGIALAVSAPAVLLQRNRRLSRL
jgi:hypothetical protein